MIKFLRIIRQRLLTENKFSKYLLYAFGEIVLVVIGILIALQINTWNENEKNKTLEKNYLNRISKDLDNDLRLFDQAIELAQGRNERLLFLEEALENAELAKNSPTYFVQSIVQAGYTFRPAISYHSFEELKSIGRLALIRNEELRTSIAKYYDYVFNNGQWDFLLEETQIKYNDYSKGILNQKQLEEVLVQRDSLTISSSEVEEIYRRFLSKKEFHSLFPIVFQYKYAIIESMNSSKEFAERLKTDIQVELKKD